LTFQLPILSEVKMSISVYWPCESNCFILDCQPDETFYGRSRLIYMLRSDDSCIYVCCVVNSWTVMFCWCALDVDLTPKVSAWNLLAFSWTAKAAFPSTQSFRLPYLSNDANSTETVFRSTLQQGRPNNAGLNCPSVCPCLKGGDSIMVKSTRFGLMAEMSMFQ